MGCLSGAALITVPTYYRSHDWDPHATNCMPDVDQEDLPNVVHLYSEDDFREAMVSARGFEWSEAQEPGCPTQACLRVRFWGQGCGQGQWQHLELEFMIGSR